MLRRRQKYGAKRTQLFPGGRVYDSGAEAARAAELRLMEHAGEIQALEEQVKVTLTAGITWKLDFAYDEGGRRIWEDVKGVWSREGRLKRKLWKVYGPGILRITKRRGVRQGFQVVEEVCPS